MPGRKCSFPVDAEDWLSDEALQQSSLAAQGLWFNIICVMQRAGGEGVLEGTIDGLARLFRCSPEELRSLLHEIGSNGVGEVICGPVTLMSQEGHRYDGGLSNGDVTGQVTVVSRRLQREYRARESNRLRQARHREKRQSNAAANKTAPGTLPALKSSSSKGSSKKKKGTEVTRNAAFDPKLVPIPPTIDTPRFRKVWCRWCDERRSWRKPLTEYACDLQLKLLSGLGEQLAIESIHNSVNGRWEGLFDPRRRKWQDSQPKTSGQSFRDGSKL